MTCLLLAGNDADLAVFDASSVAEVLVE